MELLGESAFSGFGGQWCSGTDSGEETTPWLPSSLGFWDSLDESSSSFSTKAFANAESFSQIDMSEAKMALFSFMKETKKMIRANNIAPPAIKKRFLNLSSGRLSGLFNCKAAASCSSVCVSSPNHFSRILIIALLSVTRNIALETLGTKGDPLRNACKNPARVQFRYICCSFSTKSSKDKYKQYLKLQIDRELLTNPKPAVCPLLKGTPILNFFPSLGFSQPLRTVVEQLPGLHAQVIASRSPLLSFGFGFSPPTATMKVVSSINTTKIDMSGVKMPLFLYMKEMKKMIRADNINTAAIMNSSLNLFSGRLSGSFKLISCSCERYVSSPNHFSIVLIISSLSVTCNIALETSGTKGDPFGNACKNKKISVFSAKRCSKTQTTVPIKTKNTAIIIQSFFSRGFKKTHEQPSCLTGTTRVTPDSVNGNVKSTRSDRFDRMINTTSLHPKALTIAAIALACQQEQYATLTKYGFWVGERAGLVAEEIIGTFTFIPMSVTKSASVDA
nr:glutamate receptor, ionotropic, plant [Ipomoea batatas]GMC78017.1 glutamate receptor, ionotropic, plant [Ipomoea batatas]